jgi:hypothetical protein
MNFLRLLLVVAGQDA